MRDVLTERRRVESIAKFEKRRQAREGGVIEPIQIGEITGLVNFVDVCFFGREMEVMLNFSADG